MLKMNRPTSLLYCYVLWFCFAAFANPSSNAQDSSSEPVVRLLVVRRALESAGNFRFREVAHSGVLLESKSGKWLLLEYMPDSKAHLSVVDPQIKSDNGDHVVVIMDGWTAGGMKPFEWTRQKDGVRIPQDNSATKLQEVMQSLMKEYSVIAKEHCHTAQERLRENLGVLAGQKIWDDDPFVVDAGQITFDAEGHEGGPYHSRVPHVPSDSSGLTIGRGYDFKERTALEVSQTLKSIGLDEKTVLAYAGAIGLSGDTASKYKKDNADKLIEISPAQQKRLFEITYAQIEADVKRICAKQDVVDKYGATDWQKLNLKIKAVLVDLRFRGDYHPESRKLIQKHVAKNQLDEFTKALSKKENWPGVPEDRFNRRIKGLE